MGGNAVHVRGVLRLSICWKEFWESLAESSGKALQVEGEVQSEVLEAVIWV